MKAFKLSQDIYIYAVFLPLLFVFVFINCVRVWLLYFDTILSDLRKQQGWRNIINPITESVEKSFFFRTQHTWGNERYLLRFGIIFVVVTSISVGLFRIYDLLLLERIVLWIFAILSAFAFLPVWYKLRGFYYDNLGIRTELWYLIVVSIILGSIGMFLAIIAQYSIISIKTYNLSWVCLGWLVVNSYLFVIVHIPKILSTRAPISYLPSRKASSNVSSGNSTNNNNNNNNINSAKTSTDKTQKKASPDTRSRFQSRSLVVMGSKQRKEHHENNNNNNYGNHLSIKHIASIRKKKHARNRTETDVLRKFRNHKIQEINDIIANSTDDSNHNNNNNNNNNNKKSKHVKSNSTDISRFKTPPDYVPSKVNDTIQMTFTIDELTEHEPDQGSNILLSQKKNSKLKIYDAPSSPSGSISTDSSQLSPIASTSSKTKMKGSLSMRDVAKAQEAQAQFGNLMRYQNSTQYHVAWTDVVVTKFGYEAFMNYLSSEFSVENFLFVSEV